MRTPSMICGYWWGWVEKWINLLTLTTRETFLFSHFSSIWGITGQLIYPIFTQTKTNASAGTSVNKLARCQKLVTLTLLALSMIKSIYMEGKALVKSSLMTCTVLEWLSKMQALNLWLFGIKLNFRLALTLAPHTLVLLTKTDFWLLLAVKQKA